jgi:Fe-S-cluster-containing dehydrogenase component
MYFLPVGCQHCNNPACVSVCPTQASHVVDDGTIQIDKQKCIGCQFCVMACPYGVRYLNEEERVVEKCTLCQQKTAQGELPQCVSQCAGRARYFGDIDKGIENMEGPGDYRSLGTNEGPGYDYVISPENSSYDAAVYNARVALGDYVDPFTDGQIHALPDGAGTHPSFRYILRDRDWKGGDA